MPTKPFANVYALRWTPDIPILYRAARSAVDPERLQGLYVPYRGHFYAGQADESFREPSRPDRVVLSDFIRNELARALVESSRFFDVRRTFLTASIARELLHKERSFSIARSVELQVLFDHNQFYLAVLAALRVYNRLPMNEVLARIQYGRGGGGAIGR